MISRTFQNNTFVEGMDCDTDISVLSNNRYRYAENIRVITNDEGTSGVLQGIEGVKKYTNSIPSTETIIGTTTINQYAIVITVDASGCNRIYRITDFDQANPTQQVILKGYLGLCQDLDETPNLSLVANYESDGVIKIYFTDGKSSVKTLNVSPEYDKYTGDSELVDSSGNIINTLALDITPGCTLPPMRLYQMGIGSLPSGVVQYCYQLFNLRGTESTTSPLSELIHLTASSTNQDSQNYMGSYQEESSNKSCTMRASLITKDFERCRIIRLLYYNNNQPPLITIVDEIEVLPTQSTITYTDTGNSYMGDISIDEFNSLTGYQFIGTTLTKMQNRLFVADITEDTWDPGFFDARAYRCNASGTVALQSSDTTKSLSFNIDSYDLSSIPEDHDCINPYNNLEYATCSSDNLYVYGVSSGGSRKLGGHGLNIDYSFITTNVILADDSGTLLSNDCSMNVDSRVLLTLGRNEIGSSTQESFPVYDGITASRIPNYADPFIAANLKGYQRDEIYRFGIIFYNNKSLPSPVYWIGDIKMPHAAQSAPFVMENGTLYGKALGIRFVVRNVPDGAVAYEIVRCDRTENDRHVVMQTVASNIYEYKIQEQGKQAGEGVTLDSSVEARPTPFLTSYYGDFSTTYLKATPSMGSDGDWGWKTRRIYHQDVATDYIKLVSPEICVQKDGIEQYLKDASYMDMVGAYFSPTSSTSGDTMFATADQTLNNNGETISWVSMEDFNSEVDNIVWHNEVLVDTDNSIYRVKWINRERSSLGALGFSGMISKYYYPNFQSNSESGANVNITDCKYATDIPYNGGQDLSAYRFNVGERQFTNWAMTNFRETSAQNIMGPAGPALIVYAQGYHTWFPGVNGVPSGLESEHSINAVPIINIKRNVSNAYGGNTYVSRQNSVYISIDNYVRVTSTASVTIDAYGGDIYLGLLDYPCMFTFQMNDAAQWNWCKSFVGAYIPFETSINTNLYNGDMIHRSYTSSNFIDVHLQMEPQQTQQFHVQDRPYFVYNSVYSSQTGAKQFVSKSIYDESNMHTSNRILVSQAKTNNEILDNWTQFKAADYLDVDNQYGGITNLKVFRDKLFYFQSEAVGIASVNERSLITDNNSNELVLGTGGILTRFDYVTTINGSSIKNDRSITDSDTVMYWYDYDKNEICAYNGAVNSLSKEKNIQSYLNEMYDKKRNVNLAFYDKKYNEVWFKFYDKSLIFNEQIGRFTSFYTFNPDWNLPFSNKNVVIKDNLFYVINTLDTDGLGEVDKTSLIRIVVNKDVMYTKTFDNVAIFGQLLDANGANTTTGLIDYILFNTKHQTATATNPTFDYRENTYRLPIPRQDESEQDTSMSFPARMRGKCMVCDYHFNSGDENTFRIPLITTTYRYSLI